MKYTYWMDELRKVQTKVEQMVVEDDIFRETITVKDSTGLPSKIVLGLGGNEIRMWLGEKKLDQWTMRRFYSSGEPQWAAMLANFQKKAELAETLHEKLLELYVEPFLKDAVLARMRGSDLQSVEEILQHVFTKKSAELFKELYNNIVSDCEFELPDIGNNELKVKCFRGRSYIYYGGIELSTTNNVPVKTCLHFLAHHPQIMAEILALRTGLEQLSKVLKVESK